MTYKNLIVMVKDCQQVSPDDYESVPRIIDIDESTTIGQIMDWYRETFKTRKWDVGLKKNVDVFPDSIRLINILQKEVMPTEILIEEPEQVNSNENHQLCFECEKPMDKDKNGNYILSCAHCGFEHPF